MLPSGINLFSISILYLCAILIKCTEYVSQFFIYLAVRSTSKVNFRTSFKETTTGAHTQINIRRSISKVNFSERHCEIKLSKQFYQKYFLQSCIIYETLYSGILFILFYSFNTCWKYYFKTSIYMKNIIFNFQYSWKILFQSFN